MATNTTRLLMLRKEAGLSLRKLAKNVGLHHSYLSLLERNLRRPHIDTALAIADALSKELGRPVTVGEIFGKSGKTA